MTYQTNNMAKMLPPQGKFVDVSVKVTDSKQLVLCGDCQQEMMVRSVLCVTSVDKPDFFTVNHNFICPHCQGMGMISLDSPHDTD
jgi:hypothetical protein